jgi:hypothetical protein
LLQPHQWERSVRQIQKEKWIWHKIFEYPKEFGYLVKKLDNEEIPRDKAAKDIKYKLDGMKRIAESKEHISQFLNDQNKCKLYLGDFRKVCPSKLKNHLFL